RWRWWVGSAGMLSCLLVLLAPSASQAGCGADVHIFSQSFLKTNPSSDERGPASLPDRHKPCSGPGCSRNTSIPFQAPTSAPSDRLEQWGQLSMVPIAEPPGSAVPV